MAIFRLLAFGAFLVFSAILANARTCDLNLTIYKFTNAPTEELVNDVTIELTGSKTKQKFPSVSKERSSYFENLEEGEYQIVLKKPGFKKTVTDHTLSCEYASDGRVDEIKFLWEGDQNAVVNVDSLMPQGERTFCIRREDLSLGEATEITRPVYPPAARAVRARGQIHVEVLINELGKVVRAKAVSGNILLHKASVDAALKTKFKPTLLTGMPVKVSGLITFNFVP